MKPCISEAFLVVVMISKNKLKELASYRQQKVCDEQNLFVVEGLKMALEANKAGVKIKVMCYTSIEGLEEVVSEQSFEVLPAELERISLQKTPNQVWLLCERDSWPLSKNEGMVLALDHLQDPGNMGTIIRTADWFGIRHIVCSHNTVSCYNPKVVQSTMGGLFRTTIEYTNLGNWLDHCNKPICGALLNGENVMTQDLPQNAVLVIGNESKGISPEIESKVTHRLLIPNIGGTAESLNASVAAGILISMMKLS